MDRLRAQSPLSLRTRIVAGFGLACVLAGLVCNVWMVAALVSPDGTLEPATRRAIWWVDAALVAIGLTAIGARRAIVSGSRSFAVHEGDRTLQHLLVGGLLLRVLVYLFLAPDNNDPHYAFVQFIVEHGRLPLTDELIIAFHPPLYYLLAAPFAVIGTEKLVQLLSLALSVVNLVMLHRLIRKTRLLGSHQARCHAMALAALLPQFVLFGLFVSNDALAFPLGTLLFVLAFRYLEEPTRRHLIWMAVAGGAGLLTKGTFSLAIPALAVVIVAVGWRRQATLRQHVASLALFGVLVSAIGCYKYVENEVHMGTPVPATSEVQGNWMERQGGTWQGWTSLADVDVVKLVRHPLLDESTKHSIPLLFYGTFWYSYLRESNFNATRVFPLALLPRAIYLLGLLPTLLIGIGAVLFTARMLRTWGTTLLAMVGVPLGDASRWTLRALPEATFRLRLQETAVVLLLGFTALTVLIWAISHDAWGFFQARLVFAMFFSIAVFLGAGYEVVRPRHPDLRWLLDGALLACYGTLLLYYFFELTAQVVHPGIGP